MNIALLTQAVQGAGSKSSDGHPTSSGQFLDLLSAMLGISNTTSQESSEVVLNPNAHLQSEESTLLTDLSNDLEQWLQQPDSLEWLKSLPQDAYRQFMDAYIGILAQAGVNTGMIEDVATSGVLTTSAATQVIPTASMAATVASERDVMLGKPTRTVSEQIQIIQQVVSKFKGDLAQSQKHIPAFSQNETSSSQMTKESPDWFPKGAAWSRPQIDSEMVMYASKGSLPENLQARIEAALQRAPFKSGADGSKVFTVRLYPEQLGELVVKLERQNGELVVKLFASNQEAKQLLQSQVQQLQQTLQPLSHQLRVEVSLTQQALEAKSSLFNGSEQSEPEQQEQPQPKGDQDDDDHPTEDE